MKAEDTVLKDEEIQEIWEAWILLPPALATFNEHLCQRQAEISFKAGMKVVAAWVEKYDLSFCPIRYWQAKLKEWGIE